MKVRQRLKEVLVAASEKSYNKTEIREQMKEVQI